MKAKDMVKGKWYRTPRTGRFVFSGHTQVAVSTTFSGETENHLRMLVDLVGDSDMQSQEWLEDTEEVTPAEPKK